MGFLSSGPEILEKTFLVRQNSIFISSRTEEKENRGRVREQKRKHEMSVWNEGIIPNRTKVIIVYPTVSPEVVIVPIVSSIFIFPIVAFLIICCLRKRAARARQKSRLAKSDVWNEGGSTLRYNSCTQGGPDTPYGDQNTSMARFSPPPSKSRLLKGYSISYYRRFTTTEVEMTSTVVDLVTPDNYHCYHSRVQPRTPTPTSSSQDLALGVLPILKVLETGMNSIRDK